MFDPRCFLIVLLKMELLSHPHSQTPSVSECLTTKHTSESAFGHRSFKCRIQLSSDQGKVDCGRDMRSRDSAKGKLWFCAKEKAVISL